MRFLLAGGRAEEANDDI